jgi:hypothetical protein
MAFTLSASPLAAPRAASRRAAPRASVVVRADGFIGSATNLIMIGSTTLVLAAGARHGKRRGCESV